MASIDLSQPGRFSRSRGRRIWLLISAACVVPAALDGLQTYMKAKLGGGGSWQDVVFQGSEWLFLGALTPMTYYLGKRFPLQRTRWKRALAAHVAGALGLCVGWASLGVLLGMILHRYPAGGNLLEGYVSWVLTSLPWSVFMYFAVLGCVYAFTYFIEAKEREAQASRLAAQLAEARLGALRMQIHPHFLFNSLNAVAVLVRDRRTEDATNVIEQLSEILREVLGVETKVVTLARELEFVRRYLAIEQVRFSDRIEVRWNIAPEALDALVPSFLLQPLIENALRHGVAAISARTTVDISAELEGAELRLSVSNDAPDAASRQQTRGRGLGVSNTRERLATLFGDRASFSLTESEGRVRAEVRMPYQRDGAADEEVK